MFLLFFLQSFSFRCGSRRHGRRGASTRCPTTSIPFLRGTPPAWAWLPFSGRCCGPAGGGLSLWARCWWPGRGWRWGCITCWTWWWGWRSGVCARWRSGGWFRTMGGCLVRYLEQANQKELYVQSEQLSLLPRRSDWRVGLHNLEEVFAAYQSYWRHARRRGAEGPLICAVVSLDRPSLRSPCHS